MHRFKIFTKPTFLVFAFFLLILSVVSLFATPEKQVVVSIDKIDKIPVDQNAIKIYKWHQQELNDALTTYFERAIASGDIIGAGVSIVKGDSIIISEGFGKRNIKLKDKVDKETVFRLGSISKGFAGVLAAKLKSEGVLDWTDKVSDYIPNFQLGDIANTNQITLATILSQTSGAPYHSYTNLVEAGLSLTEIATRFKVIAPISKPGKMYSYQNAMFALSGEIMQRLTHQDITTLLNDRFFKPLEMNTVSMDYQTLEHTKNVALPHSKSGNNWKTLKLNHNYYNAVAAGGINASALDMAKWMELLLGHHSEIINKSALQEVFNPFIEIKEYNKYYQHWPGHISSSYGFGWRIHKFLENNEEKTMLHHGGSVNSYRNEIAVYPDADLGICVLLNSNSKLAKTVIPDIYKLVKEVYNEANSKMITDYSEQVTSRL
ncbi:serine hydrolase domain-containing protein [Confluentibacter sediminis]|uniref:serine hydrolase domain-containing protein n=1 Tax=Confluentibacter sediminis TaxID=2219045 RepID=UPI000DADED4A|nr:serine hydrolase domain-containing protein [Confluentibacter sediminis]